MIEESRNTSRMAWVVLHKKNPEAVHQGAAPLGAALMVPPPDLFVSRAILPGRRPTAISAAKKP